MKINVGCGDKLLQGYTNVDFLSQDAMAGRVGGRAGAPDIVADARTIPLPDGCADEVLAVHVFEHFYLWEALPLFEPDGTRSNPDDWTAIEEWRRLLKPGGMLALEMPCFFKCVRNAYEQMKRGVDLIDQPADINERKQGVQMSTWGIYGDPRHRDPAMGHHYGYRFAWLAKRLKRLGFEKITEVPTHFHGTGRTKRDFRLEAIKL